MAQPVLSRKTLNAQLKAAGVDAWAVLPAQALEDERERLDTWLAKGHQADMAWMETYREKRLDIRELFPGAKSVVVALFNYAPDENFAYREGEPKVARYALGKDYHRVIRKALGRVLKALQAENPLLEGRPFADSAPVLEKALAARAGLGWQGKHSLLINRQLGSWVFIGSLALNMEVDAYDETRENNLETGHCGRCTRCIEACPTDAIVADTVVDSRKCIAYWTIENHDAQIPAAIAENMNNWAFGCDICQEVCPWNLKFAQASSHQAFSPRDAVYPLPVIDALTDMNDAEFKTQFSNSPLQRSGRKVLIRNQRAMNGIKT